MNEDEIGPKTPLFAWVILVLCVASGCVGAGYVWRIHDEESKPAIVFQVNQAESKKQLNRFKSAAAFVADENGLKPAPGVQASRDLLVYALLVEKMAHPCPLSDEQLHAQCRELLRFSQELTVEEPNLVIDKPRGK